MEPVADPTLIEKLYSNYKRLSDEQIAEYLKAVTPLVRKRDKFFFLTDETLTKVRTKPRNTSFTFDFESSRGERVKNLVEYKTIPFLCKSSSRFFLKPDIGEVFDQMDLKDLAVTDAICINAGTESLNSEGDHFLMTATLFTFGGSSEKELIQQLENRLK